MSELGDLVSGTTDFISVIPVDSAPEASDNLDISKTMSKPDQDIPTVEISSPEKQIQESSPMKELVSITMTTSEPDSLSGKSDSTSSITSARDNDQAVIDIGVTNQAFVEDDDFTVNRKKGHQRSPSCSLGKDETVCLHIVCLPTNTVPICFRAYQK